MLRGAGTVPGLALGLLIRVLRPLDSLDMLVQVFVCISVPLFCFAWLFVYGIEEKPHLMPYSVYSASAPRSACRPGLLHNTIGTADADTRITGNLRYNTGTAKLCAQEIQIRGNLWFRR